MLCPQCKTDCKVVRDGGKIRYICRDPNCPNHGKVVSEE